MKPCRNCARLAWSAPLVLAAFCLFGFACLPAVAQVKEISFDEIKPDEHQKKFEFTVLQLFREGKFGPGEEEKFADFFNLYNFPRWTLKDNHPQLVELRKKLRQALISAGRSPNTQVHERLNAIVLDFMNALANDRHPTENRAAKFHPIVRLNAMLMIGELNEVEPPARAAQPMPDALPVLMKNAEDPKQIEAVKIAAVVGILRHLALGAVAEPEQKQIAALMLKLLKSPLPEGQSADGHAWLQTQAGEVLRRLNSSGSVGPGGEIAAALAAVVGDKRAPLNSRCDAARQLGRLTFAKGPYIGDCAIALGRVARDCAAAESSICVIDRLKWRLDCVGAGLTAAIPAADDAQRPILQGIKDEVDKVHAVLPDNNDADITPAMAQAISDGIEKLEKLLKKNGDGADSRLSHSDGPKADGG